MTGIRIAGAVDFTVENSVINTSLTDPDYISPAILRAWLDKAED